MTFSRSNHSSLSRDRTWRIGLLGLCLLVFLFALQAKMGVYDGAAPSKITPTTASKLWLGQKMEVRAVESAQADLLWLAVLLFFGLHTASESRYSLAFQTPSPRIAPLQHLHRFLRPPPAVAQA